MSYESYVCRLLEQTRIDVIWKTGPGSGREVTVTLVARIRFFFLSEFELLVDLAWRQTRKKYPSRSVGGFQASEVLYWAIERSMRLNNQNMLLEKQRDMAGRCYIQPSHIPSK